MTPALSATDTQRVEATASCLISVLLEQMIVSDFETAEAAVW
jgi:hypothetical protein